MSSTSTTSARCTGADATRRGLLLVALFTVSLVVHAKQAPTVTLDVKDAEARPVLKEIQKQCRIQNLIIDPDVTGSGTFYFKKVPCRTALPIVLRTLGLRATTYSNNLVQVEAAKP